MYVRGRREEGRKSKDGRMRERVGEEREERSHPGWSPREQRRSDPNTLHRESPPFSQETAITIPSSWLHCMQHTAPS